MKNRRTKIIATIGPSSLNKAIFTNLVTNGVDFFRINMAYANFDQIALLNELISSSGKMLPVIYDIRSVDNLAELNNLKTIEYIALSFTESIEQLDKIKDQYTGIKVISKIETQKGVDCFENILINSWGVMIARGDLGKSISLEKVPCVQKWFSKLTKEQNRFLIIATEMMLSMVNNRQPTRAEVSDVANAVYDNADAVMLSEETAIGSYPAESVDYMRRVIEESENCI
jgi:pyruvate kinase